MNYRYHLLKYAGIRTRFTCPSCGRKHCFAPYVDDSDQPADIEKYGRCDHESSCGYCLYPPSERDWRETWSEYSSRHTLASKPRTFPAGLPPVQSAPALCTIPEGIISRTLRLQPRSDFLKFLSTIAPEADITRAVNEYRIGVARGGAVVFYQIDTQGRCRTGKVMKYDPLTGHRIKDPSATTPITWVHSLLKQQGILPADWTLSQCLFGEHLLPAYPDKPVALVESEKTAVIASIFCPDFLWLATGGKGQMNDRVEVLRGRNTVAFPDIDGIDAWRRKAAERPHLAIQVSDLVQHNATPADHAAHIDLADLIIRWRQEGGAAGGAASFAIPDGSTDPAVGASAAGDSTNQTASAAPAANPVLLQIQRYISPEHHANVLAMIEEFDLEVVGVGRI
jgi:hypothetical protein